MASKSIEESNSGPKSENEENSEVKITEVEDKEDERRGKKMEKLKKSEDEEKKEEDKEAKSSEENEETKKKPEEGEMGDTDGKDKEVKNGKEEEDDDEEEEESKKSEEKNRGISETEEPDEDYDGNDDDDNVVIVKGRGRQLKDIRNVNWNLSNRKIDEVLLRILHTLLFGEKELELYAVKNNLYKFSGFVWVNDEERENTMKKLSKCEKENLLRLCNLLDIPFSNSDTEKEIREKLLEFLECPKEITATSQGTKRKFGNYEDGPGEYATSFKPSCAIIRASSYPGVAQQAGTDNQGMASSSKSPGSKSPGSKSPGSNSPAAPENNEGKGEAVVNHNQEPSSEEIDRALYNILKRVELCDIVADYMIERLGQVFNVSFKDRKKEVTLKIAKMVKTIENEKADGTK